MAISGLPSFAEPIGLFPLPNVVLLPGMVLPLQVFEERYRAMVDDALADDGVIAMALLRPGYEAYYHTNLADIHPVVGVGRMSEHVQVPDGRYFINLLGLCRARIRQEYREGRYREAMLDPMITPGSGIETDGDFAARHALREMVNASIFDAADGIEKSRSHVNGDVSLGEVVDVVAGELLPADAVEVRQRILEEMNVQQRAEILLRELDLVARMLTRHQRETDRWPRLGSEN